MAEPCTCPEGRTLVEIEGEYFCEYIDSINPSCTITTCPEGYELIDNYCQIATQGLDLCPEGYTYDPQLKTCTLIETVEATCVCTANVLASPQTICSGSTTNIVLTSEATGIAYTWTAVQSGVTGATSGNSSIIAQTLVGLGTVTYTITPFEISSQCQGVPVQIIVTVNAVPNIVVTPSSPQSISSGGTTNIAISSGVPGTTFSWTVSQTTGITGATSGTGTTIADTISATQSGSATYTILATAPNGCTATTVFVVQVAPPLAACLTGFVIETLYMETAADLNHLPAGYTYPGTFFNNAHTCDGALTEVTGNGIFLGESRLNNAGGVIAGGLTNQGSFICGDYNNTPTFFDPVFPWNNESRYSRITISAAQAALLAAAAPAGTTNVTFAMTYAVAIYGDSCDNAHNNLTWLRLSTAGGTVLYNGLPAGNFTTIDVCNQPT